MFSILYFPLELHRFSINTFQIFRMTFSKYHLIFLSKPLSVFLLPPKQSIESAKTYVLAFEI